MKNIFLFLFVLFTTFGYSQDAWKLDKAHSGITFSVSHMVISEVTGNFKDFDITLTAKSKDFADAKVESVIKVASINTENTARDKHLQADDFFNAEKFSEIKFKSTSFEKIDDKNYKIIGDLTIRDVTKRVTFSAELKGVINTGKGQLVAWQATTTINRFDFNLKWNKTLEAGGLIVGKDVKISMNLEFLK